MAFFLLLACMLPFSGGTSPFRGDAFQPIDPFGFSLLCPSRGAFGPHSMLALAGLLIIPSVLVYWRRAERHLVDTAACPPFSGGVLPLSALTLYGLFIILSMPMIAGSNAFPGPAALATAVIDLMILGTMMAWGVDFALSRAPHPRLRPLTAWIFAGAIHLARGMADAFLIAPQAREIVQSDWTAVSFHALLALIAITLHALPLPFTKTRATI